MNSFEKRTLKFYGNAKQITALECEGVIRDDRIEISKVDKLNLSNLTELKYLDVSHLSFSKLEVLNHKKIESLHGGASYFDEFSVSNCDNLNQITMLSSYRIKNLNIKKCHNLYDVTIYLWIDQEMPNDELLYCNHLFSECNSLSRILLHLTLYSNNIEIQTKTDLKIEHCSSIERLMYQNLGLEKIEMVGDFRNLIEVELSNNLLTTVDIPESSNLYRVDLSHNPLENDEESLRKIVGLLPDKTNEPNYPGEVIFREEKKTLITSWIGDILSSKNWNMQFYE